MACYCSFFDFLGCSSLVPLFDLSFLVYSLDNARRAATRVLPELEANAIISHELPSA